MCIRDRVQVAATVQSHAGATAGNRSGQDRPRAIASRMSGGEAWAIVEPSLNSTIECTTDCGCTTTAMSATHPAVYNAANEEAVAAFLAGRVGFLDIVDTVARVLNEHEGTSADVGLDDLLAAERWARQRANEVLSG